MNKSSTVTPAADAYGQLYSDKALMLKISGGELESEDLPILIQDIRNLSLKQFIIVCGAGKQIDHAWREYCEAHDIPCNRSDKENGVNKTSPEKLEHAVLPVYQEFQRFMRQVIPEGVILKPEQVPCSRMPGYGEVGIPSSIEGVNDHRVVVIGSVGSDGDDLLNVNADDIARSVLAQEGQRINEAIMITGPGGVIHNGEIAPLLWAEDIAEDGTHKKIDVTSGEGGMQKKLKEAKAMLEHVEKIVITDIKSVKNEIERILGSGTLIVSWDSVTCEPQTTDAEAKIFDALYQRHVQEGDFRERNEQEYQELKQNLHLLKVSNSILGAFALIPKGKWMKLEALCSEYNGAGVGDMLIQSAKMLADDEGKSGIYTFASSLDSSALFAKNRFGILGKVSELQRDARFYECLTPDVLEYDTSERDPNYCMWRIG